MRICRSLLALSAAVLALPAAAQTFEPDALAKLNQSVQAYKELNTYRAKWRETQKYEPKMPGMAPGSGTVEVRYARPNRLWLHWTEPTEAGGHTESYIVCNGKTMWRWDSKTRKTTQSPAPKDLCSNADVKAAVPDALPLLRGTQILADFMPKHTHFRLGDPAQQGGVAVDTVVADLSVANRKAAGKAVCWLDAATHLFRGMRMDITGRDKPSEPAMVVKMTLSLVRAEINPKLTDADFRFVAPASPAPQKP